MLADGQWWTLPAPNDRSGFSAGQSQEQYLGLLRAIVEAEDHRERRLAELALALFLAGQNYNLTPPQYQSLFTYPAGSPELEESKQAFAQLAMQHLEFSPFAQGQADFAAASRAKKKHKGFGVLRAFFRMLLPRKSLPGPLGVKGKAFPQSDSQAFKVSV